MFDYAVYGLGYSINDFFEMFLVSSFCEKFERGDAFTIAGKLGVEWALVYYQWYRNCRFSEFTQWISIQDVLQMYDKYHEMDIMAFVERLDEISHEARMETRLKYYRTLIGFSQGS